EQANGRGLLFTPLPLPLLAVGGDEIAARDRSEGAAVARGGVIPVAELRAAETASTSTSPGGAIPRPAALAFPPSHLLSVPIRVPPGLFTKRWILLYTSNSPPGGCIRSMVLGYTTSDGKHERVAVTFKESVSRWQGAVCGNRYEQRSF
ncbi:MAG TPA: hypothetical protein VH328_11295, partial [Burkholderiaceae bacterium]|nr:hypothetical protein [Burkholderiaceae bacterium]